jgi:tetratricopeptide (TPR) repeat protein
MSPFVLAIFLAVQGSPSVSQDEIREALMRAESLYFEARFKDSVQLLTQVNDVLKTQPERVPEIISTKLQLALGNVGLNNPAAAKSFLIELFALSPDFNLDAKQFPPKIVALADEAKAAQHRFRCQTAADDARRHLAAGDGAALLHLLDSMKSKCADLATLVPDTAELLYRKGLSDYKLGDLSTAVHNFRSAVKLAPKHDMAAQYLELAENKLQVAEDRVLLDWQKNFDGRQFKQAAAIYRQIASFGDNAAKPLGHMTAEYRQALVPLVEEVNRACSSNDPAKMDEARSRISEMLPEPSFGEDIRSRIVPCKAPEPPAPPKIVEVSVPVLQPPPSIPVEAPEAVPAPKVGCFQADGPLAMTRLKSRVEPEVPAAVRTFFQNSEITIRIKARIDEKGNITVSDATGANVILTNSVRAAVEKWKFTPTLDQNGPRCVDTEFPVILGQKTR